MLNRIAQVRPHTSAFFAVIPSAAVLLSIAWLATPVPQCAAQSDTAAKIVPPVILSAKSVKAKVGERISHRIASNGSPSNYFAKNLPMEFVINCATGEVSGVPVNARSFVITVEAVNSAGRHSQEIRFTVDPVSLTK